MKIPRLNFIYFTAITIFFQLIYTSQLSNENLTIRIMPLGDSITRGTNPEEASEKKGYRKYLYNYLTSEGYHVDFVGSLSEGNPDNYDRDNEGHPGMYAYRKSETALSLRDNILDYLSNNRPDIVLLHIGTNDIASYSEPKSADSLAKDVVSLLEIINNFDPNIVTILALIIRRFDEERFKDSVSAFNRILRERAEKLIAAGQKIKIADMESLLSYPEDLSPSLVHPAKNGFRKMASAWFQKIQEIITPEPVYPVNRYFVDNRNITLKWKPAIGTDYYRLQISTDSIFTNVIVNDTTLTSNYTIPYSLETDKEYYWRVRGKIDNALSPFSRIGSFTTGKPVMVNAAGQ